MNTSNTTTDNINNLVNEFQSEFCPFGWLDCKAAVETAIEAGYSSKWAAEQVQEFCDSTGSKINDVDPNYCVMDAILQEARQEIEQETGFDFMNDLNSGHIDTYGNFMCTSYDYTEEAKDELIEKLAANEVEIDSLSEATQYFLSQIEISQEDINKAKK